ncbi:MAG: hypothetical protein P1V81_06945 [Planctomycetota bacterium]|nr:hypothetical protein [Planctomycetota bacterium]
MLDPTQNGFHPWSAADLTGILRHFLSAPLGPETDRLAELSCMQADQVCAIIKQSGATTFQGLLGAGTPSSEALHLTKNYAKASIGSEADLPRDVARVVYLWTILKAQVDTDAPISSLSRQDVILEARRCLTSQWLPREAVEALRSLLER